ncbi:DNA internalization-related competence protein ComEC/Rec2 [Falsibacillus pallidus]|uniref:Competence protein ComEC n=1 Tax=Falsibacillus pallidus TaxID=493781 RepID=A0A370GK42_9BACI|nr:DNA internalization-related competence protein ComEC/Rec2 [Falsibacillus pallidus]RDI44031.1 competence protein ComEC [Falsibacillus pallidus]
MFKGHLFFYAYSGAAGIAAAFDCFAASALIICHLIWLLVRIKNKAAVFLCSASFILFLSIGLLNIASNTTEFSIKDTHFNISLLTLPQFDGDLMTASASTETGEHFIVRYTISSPEEKDALIHGLLPNKLCPVSGRLESPSVHRNFNSFDYHSYLETKKIHWILVPEKIELRSCVKKSSFNGYILSWRSYLLNQIDTHFSAHSSMYIKALLLGERGAIPDDLLQTFRQLGIVHLLAISGLHVGLIAAGTYIVLLRTGFSREWSMLILAAALPIYGFLTGGNPPVMRAVVLFLFLLLSKSFPRIMSTLDSISAAALLFMALNPYLLFDIGFQLSYAVCFSLGLSKGIFKRTAGKFFGEMLAVTAVCQSTSIPIILYHFYEISLAGYLANSFFVPLFSVLIIPISMLLFLLSFIPHFPIRGLDVLFSSFIEYMERAADQMAKLPFAVLTSGKPNSVELVIILLAVFIALFLLESGNWKSYCVFTILLFSVLKLLPYISPFGSITFIDIGQGDSILIDLPFRKGVYLIDTGGQISFPKDEWQQRDQSFSIAEDILSPYLKSKGITKLDGLILTHSDNDHIGAALKLLDEVRVKKIFISPHSWEKPIMMEIVKKADKKGIPIVEITNIYELYASGASFTIIPPEDEVYEGNDDSLILFARAGGKTWLFTGDLEKKGEKELMKRYHLQADILKIGHHGSKTSTSEEFLEEVEPSVAVISVGKDNRYGHPSQEVLERLKERGVKIWRTDRDGAVEFRFYGKHGTFTSVIP